MIQNLQQQAQLMLTMINGQQVAAVAAQSAANIANIAAKTEKSTDVPTTTELSGKTDSKT